MWREECKTKPITAIANIISIFFSAICGKILGTGVFPPRLKITRVSMIHEGGPINTLKNYSPISALPLFSKVIETIINSRVSDNFSKHNLLVKQHYDFQKKNPTEQAFLNIKNKI